MARYTANYGLHQWEPEDHFLRTDFNKDFASIDAALGRAEGKGDRALAGLEPVSYNLYNLMLQAHYEGKYTGYKRALLFDGFSDGGQIAGLEGGMTRLSAEKCLYLDGAGQGDLVGNYGTASTSKLQPGGVSVETWTPEGDGLLTAIHYRMGSGSLDVLVYRGNTLLGTSAPAEGPAEPDTPGVGVAVFQTAVEVRAGVSYELRVRNRSGSRNLTLYLAASGAPLGWLRVTPIPHTEGGMTTAAADPQAPWSEARAWVRHSAGTLALELHDGTAWTPMAAGGTRSVRDLQGKSCRESAFSLTGLPLQQRTAKLRLTMTVNPGERGKVYDYGVILI